jgi:elongator complex protein 3
MLFDAVTPIPQNVRITTRRYEASDGWELFISAEDDKNNVLIGYLRLRLPSTLAYRPEVTIEDTAIVRELHVYGPLVPVGGKMDNAWQHRGYGRTLLETAEKVSLKNGRNRILVTSALGVRQYFKQRGYRRRGPYMEKTLE